MKLNTKYEANDYRRYGNNPRAPYNHAYLSMTALTKEDLKRLHQDIEQMMKVRGVK